MISKYKILFVAVVAMVALTGCLQGAESPNGNENSLENTTDEATVAVALGVGDASPTGVLERLNLSQNDQILLQQAQQSPDELSEEERQRVEELQQEIQQAQQEMQAEEEQAVEENREAFESAVEDSETLAVEDSINQSSSSLFLVTGSPSEILGLLEQDGVEGILSESRYEDLREQRQQQAPAPGGPPAP
ncbi:MAG: hypothetical protein U5J64_11970 [Halobacteriales archaeon]|nr:hypothetical protein [Halobacteriales archaeon]